MKKGIIKILLIVGILSISMCGICFATDEYDANGVANFLKDIHVLNGYPDGDLRLNNNITREEFSKLIVLISNFRNTVDLTSYSSTFKDVEKTRWSAPYIKVAVQNSILQGYPDLTFRPANNITLEEATVISLRLLQYSSNDYGVSWPYSQINFANEKGILNGVKTNVGQEITRKDAITIMFNTLCSKINNTQTKYINVLKYTTIDDMIVIATSNEDKSLEANQVYTSTGIFKCVNKIDNSIVGTKATAILNEDGDIISIVPQNTDVKRYMIKACVNNGIIVNNNGINELIEMDTTTTLYYKMQKMTVADLGKIIKDGSMVSISKTNNKVNYVVLINSEYVGPIVVKNNETIDKYANANIEIIKDNKKIDKQDININDVIYYYSNTNQLFVYDNKITGIIEQMLPNKYTVSSIKIAGNEYKLETENAYINISKYSEGDAVTVLLGKDNMIVDVINLEDMQTEIIGLLVDSGVENKTNSYGENYTVNYVTLILSNGNTSKYTVDKDYSDYINEIVRLTYNSNKKNLVVSKTSTKNDVYGIVDSEKLLIGNTKLSSSVKIIEIPKVDKKYLPVTKVISLNRLNNVNILSSNVVNYTKDNSGKIDNLIITDVTNDMYDYGIVISEKEISPYSANTYYTCNISGREITNMTNNIMFNIGNDKPAGILTLNGNICDMFKLTKIKGKLDKTNGLKFISSSIKFTLESNTLVYQNIGDDKYYVTELSNYLRENTVENLTAYYDKEQNKGGKIRLIVIE